MLGYIVRRIVSLMGVLLIVSMIVFSLTYLVPGNPVTNMLGVRATPENVEELMHRMGLDKPFYIRYGSWLGKVITLDLGTSYTYGQPVGALIASRFPLTLTLALYALVIAMAVGIPLGIIAGVKHGSYVDALCTGVTALGLSIPSFWLALNLISLFAVRLRWLPSGGFVSLTENPLLHIRSMLLPAASLGLIQATRIARMTRSTVLETILEDYVQTARSKGLRERVVILKHAMKNALLPVITLIGVIVGVLLGGAVVIELVFTLPGLGRMSVTAVQGRDYMLLQGITLCVAGCYALANLLVDLCYVAIDPRIKYT